MNNENLPLEDETSFKERVKKDIEVILPFVEQTEGKTPEEVESMTWPEGSHLERVSEDKFILDYNTLGVNLDIEEGKVVPDYGFLVYSYTEDDDLCVYEFYSMVDALNCVFYNYA